ncbi:MAG: hypothetical protein KatS3mg102_0405 [Planctomycetota bacterium]|nr:MAG: hypothetical protein KatS3mg102_0405 [Planctomycetota bacterium]
MRRRLLAQALALAVLLGAAAAPAHAGRVLLTGYDLVATPGEAVRLRFKAERFRLIRWDMHGLEVEFYLFDRAHGGWQRLGSARSAGDGYADLLASAPAVPGHHWVAARLRSGQRHWSDWAYLYLGVLPPGARVVVTDIDHTIYDGGQWGLLGVVLGATGSAPPVQGAVAGLQALAADAAVVYLTARDDYFTGATRRWLAHWRFPPGALFVSDGLGLGRDPTAYKAGVIAALKARFDVAVAFGDRETDLAAYQRNQVPAFIFARDPSRFPGAEGVYEHWDALRAAVHAGAHAGVLGWASRF